MQPLIESRIALTGGGACSFNKSSLVLLSLANELGMAENILTASSTGALIARAKKRKRYLKKRMPMIMDLDFYSPMMASM